MKTHPVRYMFMHTLDQLPAFYDGDQIAFFPSPSTRRFVRALVDSMDTIREQRKLSLKWRKSLGFDNDSKYGVVRIEVV